MGTAETAAQTLCILGTSVTVDATDVAADAADVADADATAVRIQLQPALVLQYVGTAGIQGEWRTTLLNTLTILAPQQSVCYGKEPPSICK